MTGLARLSGTTLADWALGGLGFSMAAASAGFAAYMITTAPAEVVDTGSREFNIFVRWDRRTPAIVTHGPVATPREPAVAQAVPPPPEGPVLDITPVGSIPAGAAATAQPRALAAATGVPATGSLHEFRVRDVFGDNALIEHRSKLTLVKPGSILAGAGEVLAIERQGEVWVVRTAQGIIGGP